MYNVCVAAICGYLHFQTVVYYDYYRLDLKNIIGRDIQIIVCDLSITIVRFKDYVAYDLQITIISQWYIELIYCDLRIMNYQIITRGARR